MPEDDRDIPNDRIPDQIRKLSENHHRQLQTLDKRAQDAVQRRLQKAAERVKERANALPESAFRRQQDRVIEYLSGLTETLTRAEVEGVTSETIRSGFRLAPAQTEDELKQWGEHYGLEIRPLNLQAIGELDKEILIQRIPSSLQNWGPEVASAVQDELATSLAERAPTDKVVGRIERIIMDRRYKADRIVRTELQEACNLSHHESLRYANDLHPEGVEPVKKSALATFDARTDQDSFPVHGQVRELDEVFVDGDGREYLHPPGRPNDREKEIPWMENSGADIMSREEGIERAQTQREALEGARQRIRERTRDRIEEFADAGEASLIKEAALDRVLADALPSKEVALTAAGLALTVGGAVLAIKTGAAGKLLTLADDLVKAIKKVGYNPKTKQLFAQVVQQLQGLSSRQAAEALLPGVAQKQQRLLPPAQVGTAKEILRPGIERREAVRVLSRDRNILSR